MLYIFILLHKVERLIPNSLAAFVLERELFFKAAIIRFFSQFFIASAVSVFSLSSYFIAD